MSKRLSYRLANLSWTVYVWPATTTLEPRGIALEAAIVTPCTGGLLFAHNPFDDFGQQICVQLQYAVMTAVMMLVVIKLDSCSFLAR